MDKHFQDALAEDIEFTNRKRLIIVVMDKIAPNNITGQIHALIVPFPTNPLSETLLAPVMLDVSPVTEHRAAGLATTSMDIVNKARVDDELLGDFVGG